MGIGGVLARVEVLGLMSTMKIAQPEFQLAAQGSPGPEQATVARGLDQRFVKIQVQAGDFPERAGLARCVDVPAEFIDTPAGQGMGRPGRRRFEQKSHREKLLEIANRQLFDHGTPRRRELEQSLPLQSRKRFANRHAAHSEASRLRGFGKAGSGQKVAAVDFLTHEFDGSGTQG